MTIGHERRARVAPRHPWLSPSSLRQFHSDHANELFRGGRFAGGSILADEDELQTKIEKQIGELRARASLSSRRRWRVTALVRQHERELRLRELAIDDVQIGAADPAGAHLEQQLTGPRPRARQLDLLSGLPLP